MRNTMTSSSCNLLLGQQLTKDFIFTFSLMFLARFTYDAE